MDSGFDTYMNSGYNFDRLPKKTLMVRWHSSALDPTTINLDLVEPFKIDTLCDVYLDNFTTFHSTATAFATNAKSAFVLNVNEFNIKSNIASNSDNNRKDIFNNIVIPSDALTNNTTAGVTKSHKSKKMNYICSINPTTITKITGSITDLNGGSIFANKADDMFLAEFVFVARK